MAWLLSHLFGAWCPDDQARREAHTDSVARRAEAARARSEEATDRAAAMLRAYEQADHCTTGGHR